MLCLNLTIRTEIPNQRISITINHNTVYGSIYFTIECGKRFVTDIELVTIAKVLGRTLEELLL